jgi:2-phospho-L-lactate/phosphoenolpyruvate guanylyltransferase
VTVTVIIPVNRLDRAKGRLAELLTPDERAALTLATLRTVLTAVREAGMEPSVLAADLRLAALLGPSVTIVMEDPSVSGLNAQLEFAVAAIDRTAVLILHADLPLATAESLRVMLAAGDAEESVTLVRSPDGGTNAMLLRPPGRFPLAYGPGSFAAHVNAAGLAGLTVSIVESPELALDLDTPADLRTLLSTPTGRASAAGELLLERGVEERLG